MIVDATLAPYLARIVRAQTTDELTLAWREAGAAAPGADRAALAVAGAARKAALADRTEGQLALLEDVLGARPLPAPRPVQWRIGGPDAA